MAETIKIRLRKGANEIELEGDPDRVDAFLSKFWGPASDSDEADGEMDPEPPAAQGSSSKRPRARRPRAITQERQRDAFDPQPIVNAIRERPDFDHLQERVLHGKDLLPKIKLVCVSSEARLTTGEITKVLDGLGVKADRTTVSKGIDRSSGEFLQDSARKPGAIVKYTLTSKSAQDFKKSLETPSE